MAERASILPAGRPVSSGLRLRQLLGTGQIVMAPGAPDSVSARLVEQAGFPAVYMTGFGATASRLGTPDIGLLTQTEMTEHARNMTRAVSIPVIADADTGYGGPSNIHRTVREHVQAGVAAIHLEDQVAPKRCGQMAGVRLIDADENQLRLKCALAARGDDDLLIIARTDALPAAGPDEAVRRARLYGEAGVDLVFVDGIKTIAEVELGLELARRRSSSVASSRCSRSSASSSASRRPGPNVPHRRVTHSRSLAIRTPPSPYPACSLLATRMEYHSFYWPVKWNVIRSPGWSGRRFRGPSKAPVYCRALC